jgi:hypothetical protein
MERWRSHENFAEYRRPRKANVKYPSRQYGEAGSVSSRMFVGNSRGGSLVLFFSHVRTYRTWHRNDRWIRKESYTLQNRIVEAEVKYVCCVIWLKARDMSVP